MAQQDVDTMRQAYAAFNRGDIPGVLAAFDQDIEWHEPGGGQSPRGTYHGSQSVADDVFATVPTTFETFQVVPDQFIDAGEHVVVVGRFRGRSKAGQDLDAPFAHVWTMRNGKAVHFSNHPEATSWARGWGG